MDLNDIDLVSKSKQGVKMTLKHPITGETLRRDDGEDMYIELTGPYHPDYKRTEQQILDNRLGRRRLKLKSGDLEAEALELAVVSTRSWNIQFNKVTPNCKPAIVKGIYTDEKTTWIRQQVSEYLADEANFLTAPSSPNSETGEVGASA